VREVVAPQEAFDAGDVTVGDGHLRHTAATAWLSAGVDVKTVQAWLGHASGELTLNLYGHHMGTDSDRAGVARMNEALGRARRKGKPGTAREVGPDAGSSAN
jgi:integrase